MTTTYFEKMIDGLVEQGLVVREPDGIRVTPAGDEYTRALIAAYPNINQPRRKRRADP